MFIEVMYQNNEVGVVEAHQLDELISSNRIKKFLRSEGWVTIGIDQIRKEARLDYKEPEKRQTCKKTAKGANR